MILKYILHDTNPLKQIPILQISLVFSYKMIFQKNILSCNLHHNRIHISTVIKLPKQFSIKMTQIQKSTNSPITDYLSSSLFVNEVTQASMPSPPEFSSQISNFDPNYHFPLHNINFTICQLSSKEVFNLEQLLCEFQDGYSQQKKIIWES